MADRITYEDKVVNGGATPSGRFIDSDADEIKAVVNQHANQLESLQIGGNYESIPFVNATGIVTISFTEENERIAKFPRPKTQVWNTFEDSEDEEEITGYKPTLEKEGGIIQFLELDGIFGTGYIILTN